jgi:hypothetical protein
MWLPVMVMAANPRAAGRGTNCRPAVPVTASSCSSESPGEPE